MSEISFDATVQDPADKVLAWDLNVRDGQHALIAFSLADGGATQIAWRGAKADEVDTLTAAYRASGFPVGSYDSFGPFVWLASPESVTVWDAKRRVLYAHDDAILLTQDRIVRRADIVRVFAYATSDFIDRGVKAELTDGKVNTLVFELSASAHADPTYSRNELLVETEWAGKIGYAIADWAKVPYEWGI